MATRMRRVSPEVAKPNESRIEDGAPWSFGHLNRLSMPWARESGGVQIRPSLVQETCAEKGDGEQFRFAKLLTVPFFSMRYTCRLRHGGRSSAGRALDCGSSGRGFEPLRPPSTKPLTSLAGRPL